MDPESSGRMRSLCTSALASADPHTTFQAPSICAWWAGRWRCTSTWSPCTTITARCGPSIHLDHFPCPPSGLLSLSLLQPVSNVQSISGLSPQLLRSASSCRMGVTPSLTWMIWWTICSARTTCSTSRCLGYLRGVECGEGISGSKIQNREPFFKFCLNFASIF